MSRKAVRRKKCLWCYELLPCSSFDRVSRYGSKPGVYCRGCVSVMDQLARFGRARDKAFEALRKRGVPK